MNDMRQTGPPTEPPTVGPALPEQLRRILDRLDEGAAESDLSTSDLSAEPDEDSAVVLIDDIDDMYDNNDI